MNKIKLIIEVESDLKDSTIAEIIGRNLKKGEGYQYGNEVFRRYYNKNITISNEEGTVFIDENIDYRLVDRKGNGIKSWSERDRIL